MIWDKSIESMKRQKKKKPHSERCRQLANHSPPGRGVQPEFIFQAVLPETHLRFENTPDALRI